MFAEFEIPLHSDFYFLWRISCFQLCQTANAVDIQCKYTFDDSLDDEEIDFLAEQISHKQFLTRELKRHNMVVSVKELNQKQFGTYIMQLIVAGNWILSLFLRTRMLSLQL